MSERETRQTRRRFLTTSAALGATLAVAGCSGGSGSGTPTSGGSNGGGGGGGSGDSISFGDTVEAELQEGAGTEPEREYNADPYSFEVESDTSIRLTMESEPFDPYVVLEGPDGDVVATQDDGLEGTFNTLLETTLEQGGEYTIWASSFAPGSTGSYTLTLEQA